MHLLGRSISVELNPGTPTARILLDQPAYNFDDQSERTAGATGPGQRRRHDPGDLHPRRRRCARSCRELKTLQPRYVVWGDGTSDEMCLAILITTRQV